MALLTLESVDVSYWRADTAVEVLKEISLEIRPGRLLAVYGSRNAGKTTLLEVAAGLLTPDRGRVRFEGKDLSHVSRKELARLHREEIGWIERDGPGAPDMSVHAYVALPLYRNLSHAEAQARARATLARVGAAGCANERWMDLPHSDRMLVAIAGALVREPRLLIADDPTSGLGIVEREAVVGLLRSVAEDAGVAVLLAAPEMPAMLHAHDVRTLSRGKLIGPSSRDRGAPVIDIRRRRRPA
ncbi:MAG: ATP-binding cassette domain-containing protein [Thermoleophilaceae bacterium]